MQYVAYYDTSGSETDKGSMLVTVGAVATVARWGRFDNRWLQVMKKYGVRSFRLTNFEHSTGEFSGWDADPQRREGFLDDLIETMRRYINKVFIRSLVLPEYEAANTTHCLKETVGGAYSLAQAVALLDTIDWLHARKNPDHDTFLPVIETGDNGQGEFNEFTRRQFPVDITYASKNDAATGETITPFNACDMIAGYHRRIYVEAQGKRRLKPMDQWPLPLQAIRKKIPSEPAILDVKFLRHFCDTLSIPARQSVTCLVPSMVAP